MPMNIPERDKLAAEVSKEATTVILAMTNILLREMPTMNRQLAHADASQATLKMVETLGKMKDLVGDDSA